jgi:hypothetical protein
MEQTLFDNKEKIEYFLLREIEFKEIKLSPQERSWIIDLGGILSSSKYIGKIVKVEKEFLILRERCKFGVISDMGETSDFKEGDWIYTTQDNFRKINHNVLSESFLKSFEDKKQLFLQKHNFGYGLLTLDIEDFKEEIDKEQLETLLKTKMQQVILHKATQEAERIKRKKEEKERIEQEKMKMSVERMAFEKGELSKFSFIGDIKGKVCVLPSWLGTTICEKPFYEVFDFWELEHAQGNIRGTFPLIEAMLINKKVGFERKGSKDFKVSFKGKDNQEIYLNGVKIKPSKLRFVINNMSNKAEEEEIKNLQTFSKMKVNFLNLQAIRFRGITLPFESKWIKKGIFEINFLGTKKEIEWEKAKELFFFKGSRMLCFGGYDVEGVERIRQVLELSKKDLFVYLRRLKSIMELKNDDN